VLRIETWLLAALGIVLAVSSATLLAADEPAAANRTQTGEVIVHVVAKTTSANGKIGGSCRPVRVTASESNDGRARVGFFESEVGGTGDQWRSSGWMAAVTSTLLSDFDPRTTRVSFEYEGVVDGPSAGAVLTCGVLAAARGDKIRPDAAMTGTINPDGSIGPVGGIAHKIDGAVAEGMKLLLIPAGIRFDKNSDTGEMIDLLEYGESKGIEVRNVFDIYEAYRLLTGAELPRPDPASTPRISLEVQKRTKRKIADWMDRYKHALNAYEVMPGDDKYSEDVEALYLAGVESLKTCQVLMTEGEFTAALWDAVVGTANSYLAMETARCRYTYANLGYPGLAKRLRDNSWLQKQVDETQRRMRRETPRTLEQLSVYLIACDTFIEGLSLQILAKITLEHLPEEDSDVALEMCRVATENQILAWLDLKLTNDYLDLQEAYQGTQIPVDAPWRDTAEYLNHAAGANLAVFNALIVAEKAKANSQSVDAARNLLTFEDKDFGIVRVANEVVFPNLATYFGDGDALGYAYLATSIYTHNRTAALLAKYYSLGAELDEYSDVVEISHERTLGEWLTFAEDQSRRNIAMLQESGIDATACAQMHAIARIKARRDMTQQLEGLVEFWSADAHARVLRRLSGLAVEQQRSPIAKELVPEDGADSSAEADGK
jgi:hypothetical protein